jgi:bla regulator protein blaR1
MIGELTNHLWQSTVFAAVVALATLAFRKNRAEVRYWLWLSASLKFLIPFSLLVRLGTRLWDALPAGKIATHIAGQAVSLRMVQIAQPFPETFAYAPSVQHTSNWTLITIFTVWACGFLGIVLLRFRGWLTIHAAMRASAPMDIAATVPVRSSPGLLEPGVVGFLRPVLLLPDGILKNLPPSQVDAVLAHEQWHIRRRDNLTSAFHMIVEAVFWFHPVVWWIGARLVEERERACDEAVLKLGCEPRVYAEGILNVCKGYLESPLRCVSGVTGSDLKKRIQAILTGHVAGDLTFSRKVALAVAGMAALALPILAGMIGVPAIRAQSQTLFFEVASVEPNRSGGLYMGVRTIPNAFPNEFIAANATIKYLIEFAYNVHDEQLSGGPDWIDSARYDVDAKVAESLVDGWRLRQIPFDLRIAQIRLMVQSLLAVQFDLKVSQDTKEQPILYALRVAKGGPKLPQTVLAPYQETLDGIPNVDSVGPDGFRGVGVNSNEDGQLIATAYGASTRQLADILSPLLDRKVVDETGLKGEYDFTLQWVPEIKTPDNNQGSDTSAADSSEFSIFTVIQDQLGLKLESETAPVLYLRIDHIEKPAEN